MNIRRFMLSASSVAFASSIAFGWMAWNSSAPSSQNEPVALRQASNPGDEPQDAAKKSSSDPKSEAEGNEKPSTLNKRKKNVEEPVYNKLTPFESNVILRRGTERAFTGEYTDLKDPGTYICRRCNAPLYHSDNKFESHCGWPSFDDEIKGAVKRRPEIDGTRRIEIVCNNCSGHLGHVFMGEGYTAKNTRHCVNSVSMKFIAKGGTLPEVIKPKSKETEKEKSPEITNPDSKTSDKPAESLKATPSDKP